MKKEIQIFNNPQFGQIRVVQSEDNETLFAAVDVAKSLGYENPAKAIAMHCKSGDITNRYVAHQNGIGGTNVQFIKEFSVYRLIMRSKLPEAEKFQDWVCEEVLPAIRKHGGYLSAQKIEEVLTNPDTIIQLAQNLKKEQQKRIEAERLNELNRPKVLFADAVETSQRSCLIAELAKIITQNGVQTGQNRLFKWMRANGFLCSSGEYYNQPTQRAMQMGLFELKKTSITKPDGTVLVTTTPKVTGKGQVYFVNKFIAN